MTYLIFLFSFLSLTRIFFLNRWYKTAKTSHSNVSTVGPNVTAMDFMPVLFTICLISRFMYLTTLAWWRGILQTKQLTRYHLDATQICFVYVNLLNLELDLYSLKVWNFTTLCTTQMLRYRKQRSHFCDRRTKCRQENATWDTHLLKSGIKMINRETRKWRAEKKRRVRRRHHLISPVV